MKEIYYSGALETTKEEDVKYLQPSDFSSVAEYSAALLKYFDTPTGQKQLQEYYQQVNDLSAEYTVSRFIIQDFNIFGGSRKDYYVDPVALVEEELGSIKYTPASSSIHYGEKLEREATQTEEVGSIKDTPYSSSIRYGEKFEHDATHDATNYVTSNKDLLYPVPGICKSYDAACYTKLSGLYDKAQEAIISYGQGLAVKYGKILYTEAQKELDDPEDYSVEQLAELLMAQPMSIARLIAQSGYSQATTLVNSLDKIKIKVAKIKADKARQEKINKVYAYVGMIAGGVMILTGIASWAGASIFGITGTAFFTTLYAINMVAIVTTTVSAYQQYWGLADIEKQVKTMSATGNIDSELLAKLTPQQQQLMVSTFITSLVIPLDLLMIPQIAGFVGALSRGGIYLESFVTFGQSEAKLITALNKQFNNNDEATKLVFYLNLSGKSSEELKDIIGNKKLIQEILDSGLLDKSVHRLNAKKINKLVEKFLTKNPSTTLTKKIANSPSYIQQFSFVKDAQLDKEKEAVNNFFKSLESKGLTPSNELMSSFDDCHKAVGDIKDPTSDKYKKYIIAKDKYVEFLKNNGVTNAVSAAKKDIKPLLDNGILGWPELVLSIDDRSFVHVGDGVYKRSNDAGKYPKLFSWDKKSNTMTYVSDSEDLYLKEGSVSTYYKYGDERTFGSPPQRVTYFINKKTGKMESSLEIMDRGKMAIVKEVDPIHHVAPVTTESSLLPTSAIITKDPTVPFSCENYFKENKKLLDTGVENLRTAPRPLTKPVNELNKTFLLELKTDPAALEKGMKYYIDKNGTVYFFEFGGDTHEGIFANNGIARITDAGWVTKLKSETTITVSGRNSTFNSREYLIDYIKNKDPDFFQTTGSLINKVSFSNDANLDPMIYGNPIKLKIEKQHIGREVENWSSYYARESVFKTLGSYRQPFNLTTDVIDEALLKGDLSYSEGVKLFIDTDGKVKIASPASRHQEVLQNYFLSDKKDQMLGWGFLELSSSQEVIEGEKMRQLKGSIRGATGFEVNKYLTDYITALYKKEGKTIPFKNINGKLYYKN